jgi:hypothetical protein
MLDLLHEADDRRLLNLRGAGSRESHGELRYGLTEKGVKWAQDAMSQNQYVGPAPVPLEAFCERVHRQSIANERVTLAMLENAFSDLIVSDRMIRELGPAINSGHSMLLYGPSGTGKSSIGERAGRVFAEVVYIPYCFEVDGQIVKVFDPSVHKALEDPAEIRRHAETLIREDLDLRWVACHRPFVVTGGELTLEMLDLSFNILAKYYEAPLHIKALGGVFLVDDFGRQLVEPTAMLNRWIVPMEKRIEYLKLHTGKSFEIPFDELVIFSTNYSPRRLMDAAVLRRIHYKIYVGAPTVEEFHRIFQLTARSFGVQVDPPVVDSIIGQLINERGVDLSGFQPKFLIEQVLAQCRFEGCEPVFNHERVGMALDNLVTREDIEAVTGAKPSRVTDDFDAGAVQDPRPSNRPTYV